MGRVVDFSVVNKLFKGWIDDNWDHGFVLWDADENAIAALKASRTAPVVFAALQSNGGEHGNLFAERNFAEVDQADQGLRFADVEGCRLGNRTRFRRSH